MVVQQFVAMFGLLGIALVLFGSLLAALAGAVLGERTGALRGIVLNTGRVMLVTGLAMCMLPGPVGSLVALMLGAAIAIAIYQRRASEGAALNEAISLAVARGIPLDRLAFAFAMGRRDLLGERAYRFAQYIQAGFAADQAAVMAKLKLTPRVRSSLARPSLETNIPMDPAIQPSVRPLALDAPERLEETMAPGVLVASFYLVILIWFATFVVALMFAPTTTGLYGALELEVPPWLAVVNSLIALLPMLCLGLLPAIAVLVGLWWLLHQGVLSGGYWFPILGPYYRSRYDAQALEWLAGAIATGESLEGLEQELRRARVGPAEVRLWQAVKLVREGMDWPQALSQASLISRGALPWLAVAHGGDHLARALCEAAAARRRHASDRLKMGLRIAGPIGVAIAAVPVLLCGLQLIGMLSHIIQELA